MSLHVFCHLKPGRVPDIVRVKARGVLAACVREVGCPFDLGEHVCSPSRSREKSERTEHFPGLSLP